MMDALELQKVFLPWRLSTSRSRAPGQLENAATQSRVQPYSGREGRGGPGDKSGSMLVAGLELG
jgi:hypothetical protein